VAAAIEFSVVPGGVLAIDLLKKRGDVEQFAIEFFLVFIGPLSGPDLISVSVERFGSFDQLISRHATKFFHEDDEMIVVAHDSESGQLTAVDLDEELDHPDEFFGGFFLLERIIVGVTSDAGADMVKGFFLALMSGSSHFLLPGYLGRTSLSCIIKNDGDQKSAK
jgi:hypothetical protein